MNQTPTTSYVQWFRDSAPYINAFRGRTFVIAFGGEVLADAQFATLVHDIALLNSLGVRLVLVHGARPQIEQRLRSQDADMEYVNGLRITDANALVCVKEAVGSVRSEIEALLSMGLANTPMEKAQIRVVSGNLLTAQPLGVIDGVDYQHTGEVRKIDTEAIHWHLDNDAIVLLPPLGYSPTGETFNLAMEDVATAAAIELGAEKLIYLTDGKGITDSRKKIIRELTVKQTEDLLQGKRKLSSAVIKTLGSCAHACQSGVPRAHLIGREVEGGLLLELFTRDGCGTLITPETFEDTRQASIEDVGGILELIEPLENSGALVRRSRESLEMEIDYFTVVERDGLVVACAALYPYIEEGVAELACLAVHPQYRDAGRGDALFQYIRKQAVKLAIQRLFVLTTKTAHWFRERGFKPADIKQLPVKRQAMYNYQRKSKVFICEL